MKHEVLAQSIRAYSQRLNDLREAIDEASKERYQASWNLLRDASALLTVLSNIADDKHLLHAMGRPGDWGRDTELGLALIAALNEASKATCEERLSKPCKHPENEMTMTSYTLFILPPNALSLREIGTLYPSDRAELDVCLLSCVSLLCGLQGSGERPCFRLSGYDEFGRSVPLALLNDHTQGWVTPNNEPFTVESP